MKYRINIFNGCLHFSSWSKKGYSVFCSLRREVKISRLATDMYRSVLLKSSRKGLIIVNTDQVNRYFISFLTWIGCFEGMIQSEEEVCPEGWRLFEN